MDKKLEEEKERWQKECFQRALKKPVSLTTSSGISVEPLLTPTPKGHEEYLEKIGFPGEFPFTRGIHPTMYLGRPWTMRQYSGFGSAEESNQRYKFLLKGGQTGLSVAFDLPTQMGIDSDKPLAQEEVGRVGVSMDTLRDMEILFDGIPLDKISTSFTINATSAIILAMYVKVGQRQGLSPAKLTGTVQNDILKEYVARGTWIFPPQPSLRLIVDIIEFCSKETPRFNPISIAGAHFRDAGANAIQEAAYTLSDAITYVEETLKRGIPIDEFASQLSFFFYTYSDFFEEIAKYRALRRLWAKLMRYRFKAQEPRSWMMRFGVVCGGNTLTAEQPLNNLVRVGYEALASVFGGCQSIFTCAWDEAYTIPTAESAETALRVQQVLAYETGVTNYIDPFAGSYIIEALTDHMEEAIEKEMKRIEKMGGMVRAIEEGIIQREILQQAYQQERMLQSGEKPQVGVNIFRGEEEEEIDFQFHQFSPEWAETQRKRTEAVKKQRNASRVKETLKALKRAAEGDENLMPFILEAVEAYCTIGEITDTLKEVFGQYKEPVSL